MNKKHLLISAIAVTILGSAATVVLAQGQQPAQPQMPMSFFITSTNPGKGADLGGLAGADAHCQALATAVGGGNVQGPWYNAKGVLIASNVADLHGDQARDRNNIKKATALDEKGNEVNGVGNMPNVHDMLTGSDSDGRAFVDGLDHTCNNWPSNSETNPAHMSQGCTAQQLIATGGGGRFYCFAIN